jgi:hypothetical protein
MGVRAAVIHPEFRRRSQQNWRATLERARVNFGARCHTIGVTEREWQRHWRNGLDPIGALLTELRD